MPLLPILHCGLNHPLGSPPPASESTLELVVSHLSSSVYYQTVKSYLAAIRSLQILAGLGDPLASTLHLELWGIKRRQALMAPARLPRLPVTQCIILQIHLHLDLTAPDNVMLWAAFSTAWCGFLHISEFTTPASGFDPSVSLSLSDLAVDQHIQATIKASKTDPFFPGRLALSAVNRRHTLPDSEPFSLSGPL